MENYAGQVAAAHHYDQAFARRLKAHLHAKLATTLEANPRLANELDIPFSETTGGILSYAVRRQSVISSVFNHWKDDKTPMGVRMAENSRAALVYHERFLENQKDIYLAMAAEVDALVAQKGLSTTLLAERLQTEASLYDAFTQRVFGHQPAYAMKMFGRNIVQFLEGELHLPIDLRDAPMTPFVPAASDVEMRTVANGVNGYVRSESKRLFPAAESQRLLARPPRPKKTA